MIILFVFFDLKTGKVKEILKLKREKGTPVPTGDIISFANKYLLFLFIKTTIYIK